MDNVFSQTAYAPTQAAFSPAIQTAQRLIQKLNENGIRMDARLFCIRKMDPEDLKFRLDAAGVPYRELRIRNAILIPKEYVPYCHAMEAAEQTKGNFLQEYEPGELENNVASIPGLANREMLTVSGLNQEEFRLMLRKCNTVKQGLLVETEEQDDGHYSIRIPSGFLQPQEKQKILRAYTQTVVGLSGVSPDTKMARGVEPSAQGYQNSRAERRLVEQMQLSIMQKLQDNGLGMEPSFGEYFNHYRLELTNIARSISTRDPFIAGYSLEAASRISSCAKQLPAGTYDCLIASTGKHTVRFSEANERMLPALMAPSAAQEQDIGREA